MTTTQSPAPVDLDALEAAAKAASAGTWRTTELSEWVEVDTGGCGYVVVDCGEHNPRYQADMAFIATANPATVLALIAELRAHLEREVRSKGGEHRAWNEGMGVGYKAGKETLWIPPPNPYPADGVSDGWIRCEERMPPTCCSVLVAGGIAYFDGVDWRTRMADSNRKIEWTVTHWMPLPAPPETP